VIVGEPLPQRVREVLDSGRPAIVEADVGHVRIEVVQLDDGDLIVAWDVSEQVELEASRDRILSTISHELRTPLTSLRGFAELLLARSFDADRQKEFLTIIRDEAVRLAHLVRDFLDLQRLRAGRRVYDFTWLQPTDLAQRAIEEVAANHPDVEFCIHVDDDVPRVSGDADALVRALVHLLDNAGRASDAGASVRVEISGDTGGPVTIRVCDDGPGIEPERLAEIFEAFVQGRSGGGGLGLALVQEIARAHEGTVHAESTPGDGATFELRLVRVAARPDDSNTLLARPSDDDILVVGFDEARARLLVEACAVQQHIASVCMNLDAARQRLEDRTAAGLIARGAPTDELIGLIEGRFPAVFLTDSTNVPGLAAQGIRFSSRPLLRRSPQQLITRHIGELAEARIVLLDDDEEAIAAIANDLRDAGATVDTPDVDAGPEAITGTPDLVVVHLRMHDDLGFRMLRTLRVRPDAWRLRVLAIADRAPTPAEQRFLDRHTITLASPADAAEAVEALTALQNDGA
jgi:signal transduction histidine kinase/CheY-like chemotaxis protein